MINIEIKRARDGMKVKIIGRIQDDADPTKDSVMSAVVKGSTFHLYSPGADMTIDEWTLLASMIDNEIAWMESQSTEAGYVPAINS